MKLATPDCGIHRRVIPEADVEALSWLGQPPSDRYARRYEAHRRGVLRSELERLTALHSIAEGEERARLATVMADLHAAIGGGS